MLFSPFFSILLLFLLPVALTTGLPSLLDYWETKRSVFVLPVHSMCQGARRFVRGWSSVSSWNYL